MAHLRLVIDLERDDEEPSLVRRVTVGRSGPGLAGLAVAVELDEPDEEPPPSWDYETEGCEVIDLATERKRREP